MRDDVVLLLSRWLLAAIFLHEGAFLLQNFNGAATSMAKAGVPMPLLAATVGLQLAGGLAIVLGWQARLGAAALGLFCVATAVLFHTNFSVRNELLHFEKDLAIAGGMFVLAVRGAGNWSLDTLRRRDRDALSPSPASSGR
jgi:putative oxidoreductase